MKRKFIVIIAFVLVPAVAWGVVGIVLHNQKVSALESAEREERLSAVQRMEIMFEMDKFAAGVVSEVKLKQEEKAARLEAESMAAEETLEAERKAAEEASKQATEKKKEEQSKAQVSPKDDEGRGTYTGLAAYAAEYIGRHGISCDMLVWNALRDMGYSYTTASPAQVMDGSDKNAGFKKFCVEVPLDQIQMSDILVSSGHFEIYIGGGMSIHGGWGRNRGLQYVAVAATTKNIKKAYKLI